MADVQPRGKRQRGENGEATQERQGFTAFNMDDENEEGHFDEDGTFIWKREEKSVQEEAWLDDLSEEQIHAARSARDRKEYRDEQEAEDLTEEVANRTLASLLRPRETVLQALQRLGSKRQKARGNKRKHAGAEQSNGASQTPEEREQFNRITEAADFLMRSGEVDVYGQIKEEFVSEEELLAQRQQLHGVDTAAAQTLVPRTSYFDSGNGAREEGKSEEAGPPAESITPREVMWEYRGTDGELHGPFPTSSFVAWIEQGYFTGDNAVDMREVAEPQEKGEGEEPKISAEEELMNDFEESDEEETKTDDRPWKRSDQIDFKAYRQ